MPRHLHGKPPPMTRDELETFFDYFSSSSVASERRRLASNDDTSDPSRANNRGATTTAYTHTSPQVPQRVGDGEFSKELLERTKQKLVLRNTDEEETEARRLAQQKPNQKQTDLDKDIAEFLQGNNKKESQQDQKDDEGGSSTEDDGPTERFLFGAPKKQRLKDEASKTAVAPPTDTDIIDVPTQTNILVQQAQQIAARAMGANTGAKKDLIDAEREAHEERLYLSYVKLQEEHDEIDQQRRALGWDQLQGNFMGIKAVLDGTDAQQAAAETRLGDWDTYNKVSEALKTFIFKKAPEATKEEGPDFVSTLKQRLHKARESIDSLKKVITDLTQALKTSNQECRAAQSLAKEQGAELQRMRALNTNLVVQVRQMRSQRVVVTSTSPSKIALSTNDSGGNLADQLNALRNDFLELANSNWKTDTENRVLRMQLESLSDPKFAELNLSGNAADGVKGGLLAAPTKTGMDSVSRAQYMKAQMQAHTKAVVALSRGRVSWRQRLEVSEAQQMMFCDVDADTTPAAPPRSPGQSLAASLQNTNMRMVELARAHLENKDRKQRAANKSKHNPQKGANSISLGTSPASPPSLPIPHQSAVGIGVGTSPANVSLSAEGLVGVNSPAEVPFLDTTAVGADEEASDSNNNSSSMIGNRDGWRVLRDRILGNFALSRAECMRREEVHIRRMRHKIAMLTEELSMAAADRDLIADHYSRSETEIQELHNSLNNANIYADQLAAQLHEWQDSRQKINTFGDDAEDETLIQVSTIPTLTQHELATIASSSDATAAAIAHAAQVQALTRIFNDRISAADAKIKEKELEVERLLRENHHLTGQQQGSLMPIQGYTSPSPATPAPLEKHSLEGAAAQSLIKRLEADLHKKEKIIIAFEQELQKLRLRVVAAEDEVVEERATTKLGVSITAAVRVVSILRRRARRAAEAIALRREASKKVLEEAEGDRFRKQQGDSSSPSSQRQQQEAEGLEAERAVLRQLLLLSHQDDHRDMVQAMLGAITVEGLMERKREDLTALASSVRGILNGESQSTEAAKDLSGPSRDETAWSSARKCWLSLIQLREDAWRLAETQNKRAAAEQRLTEAYAQFMRFEQLSDSTGRPAMLCGAALRVVSQTAAPITLIERQIEAAASASNAGPKSPTSPNGNKSLAPRGSVFPSATSPKGASISVPQSSPTTTAAEDEAATFIARKGAVEVEREYNALKELVKTRASQLVDLQSRKDEILSEIQRLSTARFEDQTAAAEAASVPAFPTVLNPELLGAEATIGATSRDASRGDYTPVASSSPHAATSPRAVGTKAPASSTTALSTSSALCYRHRTRSMDETVAEAAAKYGIADLSVLTSVVTGQVRLTKFAEGRSDAYFTPNRPFYVPLLTLAQFESVMGCGVGRGLVSFTDEGNGGRLPHSFIIRHLVRPEDTVASIALAYGVPVENVMSACTVTPITSKAVAKRNKLGIPQLGAVGNQQKKGAPLPISDADDEDLDAEDGPTHKDARASTPDPSSNAAKRSIVGIAKANQPKHPLLDDPSYAQVADVRIPSSLAHSILQRDPSRRYPLADLRSDHRLLLSYSEPPKQPVEAIARIHNVPLSDVIALNVSMRTKGASLLFPAHIGPASAQVLASTLAQSYNLDNPEPGIGLASADSGFVVANSFGKSDKSKDSEDSDEEERLYGGRSQLVLLHENRPGESFQALADLYGLTLDYLMDHVGECDLDGVGDMCQIPLRDLEVFGRVTNDQSASTAPMKRVTTIFHQLTGGKALPKSDAKPISRHAPQSAHSSSSDDFPSLNGSSLSLDGNILRVRGLQVLARHAFGAPIGRSNMEAQRDGLGEDGEERASAASRHAIEVTIKDRSSLLAIATSAGCFREWVRLPNVWQIPSTFVTEWLVAIKSHAALKAARSCRLSVHAIAYFINASITHICERCSVPPASLLQFNPELPGSLFLDHSLPLTGYMRVPVRSDAILGKVMRSPYYCALYATSAGTEYPSAEALATALQCVHISDISVMDGVVDPSSLPTPKLLVTCLPSPAVSPPIPTTDVKKQTGKPSSQAAGPQTSTGDCLLLLKYAPTSFHFYQQLPERHRRTKAAFEKDLFEVLQYLGKDGAKGDGRSDRIRYVSVVAVSTEGEATVHIMLDSYEMGLAAMTHLATEGSSCALLHTQQISEGTRVEEAMVLGDIPAAGMSLLPLPCRASAASIRSLSSGRSVSILDLCLEHQCGPEVLLGLNPSLAFALLAQTLPADKDQKALLGISSLHYPAGGTPHKGETIEALCNRLQGDVLVTANATPFVPSTFRLANILLLPIASFVSTVRVPPLANPHRALVYHRAHNQSLLSLATQHQCSADEIKSSALSLPMGVCLKIPPHPGRVRSDGYALPPVDGHTVTERVVGMGDTIEGIAAEYDLSPLELALLNPSSVRLPTGTLFGMPDKGRVAGNTYFRPHRGFVVKHTVQAFETLSVICNKYNQALTAVLRANPTLFVSSGANLLLVPVASSSREAVLVSVASNLMAVVIPTAYDTYANLARRFDTSIASITDANKLLTASGATADSNPSDSGKATSLPATILVPVISPLSRSLVRQQHLAIYLAVELRPSETIVSVADRYGVFAKDIQVVGRRLLLLGVRELSVPVTAEVARKLAAAREAEQERTHTPPTVANHTPSTAPKGPPPPSTFVTSGTTFFQCEVPESETVEDIAASLGVEASTVVLSRKGAPTQSISNSSPTASSTATVAMVPVTSEEMMQLATARDKSIAKEQAVLTAKASAIMHAMRSLGLRNEATRRELQTVESVRATLKSQEKERRRRMKEDGRLASDDDEGLQALLPHNVSSCAAQTNPVTILDAGYVAPVRVPVKTLALQTELTKEGIAMVEASAREAAQLIKEANNEVARYKAEFDRLYQQKAVIEEEIHTLQKGMLSRQQRDEDEIENLKGKCAVLEVKGQLKEPAPTRDMAAGDSRKSSSIRDVPSDLLAKPGDASVVTDGPTLTPTKPKQLPKGSAELPVSPTSPKPGKVSSPTTAKDRFTALKVPTRSIGVMADLLSLNQKLGMGGVDFAVAHSSRSPVVGLNASTSMGTSLAQRDAPGSAVGASSTQGNASQPLVLASSFHQSHRMSDASGGAEEEGHAGAFISRATARKINAIAVRLSATKDRLREDLAALGKSLGMTITDVQQKTRVALMPLVSPTTTAADLDRKVAEMQLARQEEIDARVAEGITLMASMLAPQMANLFAALKKRRAMSLAPFINHSKVFATKDERDLTNEDWVEKRLAEYVTASLHNSSYNVMSDSARLLPVKGGQEHSADPTGGVAKRGSLHDRTVDTSDLLTFGGLFSAFRGEEGSAMRALSSSGLAILTPAMLKKILDESEAAEEARRQELAALNAPKGFNVIDIRSPLGPSPREVATKRAQDIMRKHSVFSNSTVLPASTDVFGDSVRQEHHPSSAPSGEAGKDGAPLQPVPPTQPKKAWATSSNRARNQSVSVLHNAQAGSLTPPIGQFLPPLSPAALQAIAPNRRESQALLSKVFTQVQRQMLSAIFGPTGMDGPSSTSPTALSLVGASVNPSSLFYDGISPSRGGPHVLSPLHLDSNRYASPPSPRESTEDEERRATIAIRSLPPSPAAHGLPPTLSRLRTGTLTDAEREAVSIIRNSDRHLQTEGARLIFKKVGTSIRLKKLLGRLAVGRVVDQHGISIPNASDHAGVTRLTSLWQGWLRGWVSRRVGISNQQRANTAALAAMFATAGHGPNAVANAINGAVQQRLLMHEGTVILSPDNTTGSPDPNVVVTSSTSPKTSPKGGYRRTNSFGGTNHPNLLLGERSNPVRSVIPPVPAAARQPSSSHFREAIFARDPKGQ